MAVCDAAATVDQNIRLAWLDKIHGKGHDAFFSAFARMRSDVSQARADGTDHVVPVMLIAGKPIQALRTDLGKATWRKIHHAGLTTNLLRALVAQRFAKAASWEDIVAIPEHHLRSCRNAVDWDTAQFASRHAPAGQFHKFAMLYRDVIKLGVKPKSDWSVTRLRKERDQLYSAARIDQADATAWAEPFVYQSADFTFTRLVSDRELVREGIRMRHCVASYLADARAERAIVMRCDGAERATYLFCINDSYELRGFANADVSDACRKAAKDAKCAFVNQFEGTKCPKHPQS